MPSLSLLLGKPSSSLGFTTLPATFTGSTAGATLAFDGNWKLALASGSPLVERPFQDEGDIITKIVTQPVQQDLRYRQPLALGTPYNYPDSPVFTALHRDAILIGESKPRDMGAYLGEWMRTYATVPPTREVPESFMFGYQYYKIQSDGQGNVSFAGLGAYSLKAASKVVHEYFLLSKIGYYPLLQPPRYLELDTNNYRKVGDGNLEPSPSGGTWFISTDSQMIAEPSDYEIWHYPIYSRKTRYVPPPTDALFGAAFALSGSSSSSS